MFDTCSREHIANGARTFAARSRIVRLTPTRPDPTRPITLASLVSPPLPRTPQGGSLPSIRWSRHAVVPETYPTTCVTQDRAHAVERGRA